MKQLALLLLTEILYLAICSHPDQNNLFKYQFTQKNLKYQFTQNMFSNTNLPIHIDNSQENFFLFWNTLSSNLFSS